MPKRILRNLTLNAIAAVDFPCQEGAKAVIIKRRDGPAPAPTAKAGSGLARAIAKYIGSDDGAHTFAEVLTENNFDREIWPLTDALSQSIRSIMGDTALSSAERDRKVTVSVDEFLTAVRALDPPASGGETVSEKVERQLRELIMRKDDDMPTIETLTADLAKANGQITTLTAEVASEKARADTATTALETEKAAHVATTTKLVEATDETIKVGDQEFKKSVVGEASFSLAKAAAADAAQTRFEKRAEVDFAHVAGTPADKALVLKHIAAMPEDAQKAAEAILLAAENMAKSGFSRLGSGGEQNPTLKAATDAFIEKVEAIEVAEKCDRMAAMRKARVAHPDLFETYQEAGAA
jgi:hypothetical protein